MCKNLYLKNSIIRTKKLKEKHQSISDSRAVKIKGDVIMKDDKLIAKQKLENARKNYDMGKYYNTVAYCNQALSFVQFGSDSDTVKEIYFLLGLAHLELGTSYTEWDLNDSILACKYFDKVIEIDSNYVEAYLYRGLAIIKWGNSGIYMANYKLAIEDFDKVLEFEPDNEQACKYREFCYEQLSKEEENEEVRQ